jgi:hypothetical protein
MKSSYAVVWSNGGGVHSGRLEAGADRFELVGRGESRSLPFPDLLRLSIARDGAARLRGLPVLVLELRGGGEIRIASLEGTAALHDLLEHVRGRRPDYSSAFNGT